MATATRHVCNPFCIDGVHAIFFDTLASERQGLRPVCERLAYNAGLVFLGFTQVAPVTVELDGTPAAIPATRGRVIIWCGEGAPSYPRPPSERG